MKGRINKNTIDIIIVSCVSLLSFYIFGLFDVLEKIVELSSKYEPYEIDEIFSTFIVLSFSLLWFSIRRWKDSVKSRIIIDKKNKELEKALSEIKRLKGILPMCSHCKKIRNDSGHWEQVDTYIDKFSEADISHGICPECMEKHHPKEFMKMQQNKKN